MGRQRKNQVINRDISWLYFNERVLQEASDEGIPIIERIRFLGIFSNNLDEFFRIRVASINRMAKLGKPNYDYIEFDPIATLNEINTIVNEQQKRFTSVYRNLIRKLAEHNIFVVNEKDINEDQQQYIENYFDNTVRANLFPIMLENFDPASSLKDKSIYLAVDMYNNQQPSPSSHYALIRVPDNLPRFMVLPSRDNKKFIIILDDIIRHNLHKVFSMFDFNVFRAYTIKFTRDAELDIDNDISKSFIEKMSESLKQRKEGTPVRFVYDKHISPELLKTVKKKLHITKEDVSVKGGRYHNFKDFIYFPNVGSKSLEYQKIDYLPHKDFVNQRSLLDVIRKRDVMLHYPYQSFQYIIDILREASMDPKVTSIKMTIYRVAKGSKVINALINAARNGKSVTVFMELKARFDEKANIYYTEKLQDAGVKIIQSIPGFKVHCKLFLIKRKEKNGDKLYANIGTGNFNESTARLYADDALLTSNPQLTKEVNKVFHLFEANYRQFHFKNIIVSPFNFRSFFSRMIHNEIKNAKAGKEAYAIIKLNNLVDDRLIRKLYQASRAGVKIKLIVRGICTLLPNEPGMSENIEAISIVDKFLEHSRVFMFYNGGDEKYFISSADWMVRNLDNRIEVATPIYDKEIQKELKEMLSIQLNDNVKARTLEKERLNEYINDNHNKPVRTQYDTYEFLKKIHVKNQEQS
ncbi:MAG: polyphosphate kinase 1 [Bacteroidales bacterium]